MGTATFRGGIHTYEGKELSKDKPTTVLLPKDELVYPMSQHIGTPAKPLVKKGDYVLMGQKIGEAVGNISANVICSVSGTVKAVEPRLTTSGSKVESIVIENDNEYKAIDGLGKAREYQKLSKDKIRTIIKEAGIVGLGGAAFPTNVKLSPKNDEKIDYVIVNGAECEPFLTSDYRMLLEEPKNIVEGLRIVLSLFPKAKGIIAIEDNKPEAIKKISEYLSGDSKIEVKALKTKYPQGGERMLIHAITGRKLNANVLPFQVGCIVNNVDTMISIYMAVAESTPLMRRIVTVTGDAIKEPGNFEVKIGSNYNELVAAAGGFVSQPEKIISGGPMMGVALFTTDVPVSKTSSALLCFSKDYVAEMKTTSCIRCGRCATVCPARVIPQKVYIASQRNDKDSYKSLGGMECCECGCCTYVCPARLNLTQSFRETKRSILADKK